MLVFVGTYVHTHHSNWRRGYCVTVNVFKVSHMCLYIVSSAAHLVGTIFASSHLHFCLVAAAMLSRTHSTSSSSPQNLTRRQITKRRHPLYPFSRAHTIYIEPRHRPSNMSSITPASYVDDGISFNKRAPHGLHPAHIAKWINSPASETTSVYTGSYIDDGADMLDPNKHAPGFGRIDPRFYKQRKSKENEKCGPWNNDIQKAIAGDMQRNLDKMKGIGRLEVRRSRGTEDEEKKDKHGRKKRDTLTIPLPPKWGTIIIKGDDGRVFLIDEDGEEFDSGPAQAPVQQQPAKWVKAPTTITVPSLPSPSTTASDRRHSRNKDGKHSTSRDKKSKRSPSMIKALTPIPESEYEEGYQPSAGEELMSPTGFFMTGGKDGWPARSITSLASPLPPTRSSRHSSPLTPNSPVRSPPGSWPSPPLSESKTSSMLTSTKGSENGWGLKKSHRSRSNKKSGSHRSTRHDGENISIKSRSTYRPAAVEDAPDSSSDDASILKDEVWSGISAASDWGGSKANSDDSWISSQKKGSHKSSRHSTKAPSIDPWGTSQHVNNYEHPVTSQFGAGTSVQNWVGDKVRTISLASSNSCSRKSHHQNRSHSRSHRNPAPSERMSEASWDGFEIPKTLSEVSVAGTESERGWPESRSQASSPRSQERKSRASSRRSRISTHGGWDDAGSEQWSSSQKANVGGWDGTASESGTGWTASESERQARNGYDEDNSTYLNDNWGGTPVRVGDRKWSPLNGHGE